MKIRPGCARRSRIRRRASPERGLIPQAKHEASQRPPERRTRRRRTEADEGGPTPEPRRPPASAPRPPEHPAEQDEQRRPPEDARDDPRRDTASDPRRHRGGRREKETHHRAQKNQHWISPLNKFAPRPSTPQGAWGQICLKEKFQGFALIARWCVGFSVIAWMLLVGRFFGDERCWAVCAIRSRTTPTSARLRADQRRRRREAATRRERSGITRRARERGGRESQQRTRGRPALVRTAGGRGRRSAETMSIAIRAAVIGLST